MSAMSDTRSAAEVLDASVGGKLLIFGSLPPHGRDLDLLVRPDELSSAGAALAAAGFVRAGRSWARFRACDADVVDVVAAARWSLPGAELDALFAEAQPLAPFRWLCQPAPHHLILILARRLVLARGRPPDKLLRRLEETLARAPNAWADAERRAASWRLRRGMALLHGWHAGRSVSRAARVAALGELAGFRARPRRSPRRTGVIALSGIDGAGKSTQARALAQTLEKLGHPSVVEWNPMSTASMAIPRPFKDAVLRMMGSADRAPSAGQSADRARNAMNRQPGPLVHLLALGCRTGGGARALAHRPPSRSARPADHRRPIHARRERPPPLPVRRVEGVATAARPSSLALPQAHRLVPPGRCSGNRHDPQATSLDTRRVRAADGVVPGGAEASPGRDAGRRPRARAGLCRRRRGNVATSGLSGPRRRWTPADAPTRGQRGRPGGPAGTDDPCDGAWMYRYHVAYRAPLRD